MKGFIRKATGGGMVIALLAFGASPAQAQFVRGARSDNIVNIAGVNYYVHTVQKGETLYSVGKLYGVDAADIVKNNPQAAEGLREGQAVKIPAEDARKSLADKLGMRRYEIHTVAQGETAYAISRRYGVSVQTLMEDNTDLDPLHLSVGQKLNIRRGSVGSQNERQIGEQWTQYAEALSSVTPGADYHLVRPGETLYGLGKQYNVPQDRIAQANGITAETLKAGMIVKIPVEKQLTPAAAPVEGQPAGPPPVAETAARAGDGERNPLGGLFTANVEPKPYAGGTVDVALMLPMGTAGGNNTNFLDFYQGTLLALEDLKRQGVSIDMGLYDTERSEQTTAGIVNSQPFASADLIIGPVYEEALAPVLRFAQDHRVAVVSPLANVSDNESPLLYQLSPAAETKYDKLKTLLSSGGNVVVVYSASNDTELEEEIRPLLPANYKKLTYSGSTTASGLDDYLKGGADNIFVVLIRDEYTIDNFMARVSSVRTNLNARGVRTGNIRIVGSSRWQRFTNVDRTLFFKLNLCFVASYQADAADRRVQDFNRRYIAAFGTVPTLYAYRGYDAAKLFIGAYVARSGSQSYESALNQSTQPLLRMPYRFNQQRRGGNHVNQEWALVCYKSDFTIEVK